MAIVETLEVRFVAKLGNLAAQIAAVTGALSGLSGASDAAMGAVTGASQTAKNALDQVSLSTAGAEKRQSGLADKLKKTGRALKNVTAQAKKAAEGIGLHKLDEVNLVGDQSKTGSGSGGKSSSGSGAAAIDAAALDKLKEAFETMEGFFVRFHGHFKRNMKGVDEWIDKITGGLAGDMVRSLGSLGKNAAQSLTDGICKVFSLNKSGVTGSGRTLIQSLADAIRSGADASAAPSQAGSTLTDKLRSGLLSGQPSVKNAAAVVTGAAKFGGESAKAEAKSAGANLSSGLADGILSRLKKVRDAAAKLASAALNKLKGLLKIASPSKVAFQMGGYFGEGFAGGIRSCVQTAQNSAGLLARKAAVQLNPASVHMNADSSLQGMVAAALNDALGGTNIVIPLNVDGIKLGEASIRGINRVTRASGRLMLEI